MLQAQEETSRGVGIYLAVTTLYVVSAFSVNRAMAWIEAYLLVAVVHFVICVSLSRAAKRLQAKIAIVR